MDDKKLEKFARFGIATKGFVYILIGGLAALAAFGAGGQKTGSSGVLEFIAGQPFGQILLVITALGLLGYLFWRFYQAFKDPENKGNDMKGLAKRAGYFFSGAFYGFLAFTAIQMVVGAGSGSGSGGGQETVVATLLSKTYGQVLVALLGGIFLIKAIHQFYQAYSENFKKKLRQSKLDEKARNLVYKSGKIGFTARGIVIGIISFLTFRAAFTANSSQAGGTDDAFSFIQSTFGSVVFLLIAVGLVAYGVFMFIKARYSEIHISSNLSYT
ncbi:MAG: DUF1206 domain-containing protein [Cyclobacteriaceae bacterium]|nr:DUF1206 domain-containing protein [Cyclobacteriaceae bacterium]